MSETPERFEMRANFEGLISLLARNLYAEPDVFIRELVQNAHDSIRLRQEHEPAHEGRIEIEVDRSSSTLVFRDNGLGMDQDDIKQFLSVIGSTGTGLARQRLREGDRASAHSLIGQFGIGMLSAFVVADRVEVRTHKVGRHDAFRWVNHGTTECELWPAQSPQAPGTEIVVTVSPVHQFMLDIERIRTAVVRYCDFIPFPISVCGSAPVNVIDAPWHRRGWRSDEEMHDAYKVFLSHRYPDVPLDVIPIELDEPIRARGALYISDRRLPDFNTAGVVDVFVRRMFVRAADPEFLPLWAKFVRGVVDSPDLQPTAARDNIQRDEAFIALSQKLGELIVERLRHLAEHNPRRFREINRWHHYHLKGMTLFHADFFRAVSDLLLFETNRGLRPLAECVESQSGEPQLHYFTSDDAAQQFYLLAAARNQTVVNAGHLFEVEFLERYANLRSPLRLVRLDVAETSVLFDEPPQAHRAAHRRLELQVESALRQAKIDHVAVSIKRFRPAGLPAVILTNPESDAERRLENILRQPWFLESLEDLTDEALQRRRRRPLQLILNAEHGLIRWLIEADADAERYGDLLVGLFLGAVLLARDVLSDEMMAALHAQVTRLLDSAMRMRLDLERLHVAEDRPEHYVN